MAVIISRELKVPERFLPPIWTNVGDVITWDDKSWIVCHYDSTNQRVYLIAENIVSLTKFQSNTGTTIQYAGSDLANVAANYQAQSMSEKALKMIVETTVNGVTAKVFVASKEQMDGGFSWFNSDSHRKANYAGSATLYWTSSKENLANCYSVQTNGSFIGQSCTTSYGFRPCICVQM